MLCLVCDLHAQLRLREQTAGFTSPVAYVPDPLDRDVQFVVQQNGRIRAVRAGIVLGTDFLDLTSAVISGGEHTTAATWCSVQTGICT